MAKTQFLTFEIHLTDPVLVEQLQGHPPGATSAMTGTAAPAIVRAPIVMGAHGGAATGGAAVEFGTTAVPVLPLVGPNGQVVAPCLFSEWFVSTNNFPRDVATFTRKSGGWFGIPFLFGDTTRFIWRGVFVYTPAITVTNPLDPTGPNRAAIMQRRWVDAGPVVPSEVQVQDSQGGIAGNNQTRGAARTVDGGGWAIRGVVGTRTHYLTGYTGGGFSGATERESWERLYWRLSGKPAGVVTVWQAFGGISGAGETANGIAIGVTPTGQLAVSNVSNIGVFTLLGTTAALDPTRFYKVDILSSFGVVPYFKIFLDGVEAISLAGAGLVGLGGATNVHFKTTLGLTVADATIALDVAFWMNAPIPAAFNGIDWLNGSRAVVVRATGFGASMANWTGDWRQLAQNPPLQNLVGNVVSSVVSGAVLAVTTDSAVTVDACPDAVGVAAALIQMYSHRGTTSGTLGYKIAGGAPVLSAVVQSAFAATPVGTWTSIMYRPLGAIVPVPIAPFEIVHVKGADVTIGRVVHLTATVELIGAFGVQDLDHSLAPGVQFPPPFPGIHNAPYPRTPWARTLTPALAPVVIKSGTYVGNNVGQDLLFRLPVHWLWLRRLSGTPKGVRWWSSRLAAGLGIDRATLSSVLPDQLMDPNFSTAAIPPAAADDFNLATAVIHSSAVDIATWPITESLTRIVEDPVGGLSLTFSPTLPDTWMWPFPGDGGHGNVQFTVWAFIQIAGVWHGAAFVQMWKDRTMGDGSLPPIISGYRNWWGDVRHLFGAMSDYVPVVGDPIAFLVQAGNGRLRGDVTSVRERSNVVVGQILVRDDGDLGAGGTGQQEEQTIVRIAGADTESNATASTYEYVALMDPASRFLLCAASAHHTAGAGLPSTVPLSSNLPFTPDAAFIAEDRNGVENAGIDQTRRMSYKGPGNAAADATLLTGTQISPAVTFGAGTITVDTGAFSTTDGRLAYALFRRDDGSADPGRRRVVQIGSYVGDNSATRGIALTPPSERYPLFAIVAPNTPGAAFYKDPQHTGGNSTKMDNGSQVTTGIKTGGLDSITVGIDLNAIGVVHNVFVIVGGLVAGADGFSVDGEFIPVSPDSFGPTADEPIYPPTVPDDGTAPGAPGASPEDPPGSPCGGPDGINCDLTVECAPLTTRLVNLALSRIGVSKQVAVLGAFTGILAWDAAATYAVGDVVSLAGAQYVAVQAGINHTPPNAAFWTLLAGPDNTEEATLARLHYAKDVDATLRDFPWPFATRYAILAPIAGSPAIPVNSDWTYSYRRPADCVFERRIVVVRAGAVDPTPPPFQLSYDDTGLRIFTNEVNARLEYTARPPCVAGRGDPLFLDALVWKLAGSFATPLTRVADMVKMCADAYGAAIVKAGEVLRPGNPGPRTTIDPAGLDVGTGCAAANIAVVNRALLRIGAQTIANLATEQSREAEAARLIFEAELRSVLEDYPWAFCTKYEPALELVAGTATVAANADWQYAYRIPADCLSVRRIVTEQKRAFDPNPIVFRAGQDATGALLYTDVVTPTIEYTARVPCVVGFGNATFRDAFAWRLAACLAPSLAHVDPALVEQHGRGPADRPRERKPTEAQLRKQAADRAWQQYYAALGRAELSDAQEQQQDPKAGDAAWIRGRD